MAYSDIDSGKVLNKEGLLELSGQIKGYINTNMPQSYTLPTASTSTLGGVKVDGETITIADGVISAVGGGSGSSAAYTFANGLTESNGTVSWDLSDRIAAGSGTQAVIEGASGNIASGDYSHAEGRGTKASYIGSHAEGINTVANHNGAHAEGSNTKAYGAVSHAEGFFTMAEEPHTHAEGYYTRANGPDAHAEGYYAKASGSVSHAEGYYTNASGNYQHVEGKYNLQDITQFQNIVGNGTDDGNRANIFTRDWDGNEYLAGNLYVGCNDYSTTSTGLTTANAGGNKVATESYVDQAIADIPTGGEYTAGNGIDIDANNVIKRDAIDWSEPLFSVLSSGLVSNFSLGSGIGAYSSVANLAVALKQKKIAGTSVSFGYTSFSIKDLNDKMGTNYAGRKFSIDLTSDTPTTNTYYSATSTTNINSGSRTSIVLMIVGNEIWCVNGSIDVLRQLFGFNLSQVLRLKTYNATNYTSSRLDGAIQQLDTAISSKQDAIIPSAPSADGTYTLQCVVSSGTPTYSWVSV